MKKLTLITLTLLLFPQFALGQNHIGWSEVESSLIFSSIGLTMAVISFVIIDLITPGKLSEDIAKNGNIAVAILTSSMILGISIIIAAAIHG